MQGRRGRLKYGFSMTLVRPKGLLLHGETASVDAASSQSNQRSFQFIMGRPAVEISDRSLWPDLLKFHGGVFACDAVRDDCLSSAVSVYHKFREGLYLQGCPI
jgi:hypothetical protein